MTAPSMNFFYGGAGLWGYLHLTDAIFEPLVARQVLNARHWDIQAAKNDALHADRRRLLHASTSTGACTPARSTPSSGRTTWSTGSPP